MYPDKLKYPVCSIAKIRRMVELWCKMTNICLLTSTGNFIKKLNKKLIIDFKAQSYKKKDICMCLQLMHQRFRRLEIPLRKSL